MIQQNSNNNRKFTLDEIKLAHSKVKSGADFPSYIQELKKLGVNSYEHFLIDGHINYYGENGYYLIGDAKWPIREVAAKSQLVDFAKNLKTHQAGKSDYLTFCKEAIDLGIEKWIVDLEKMTCTYYNLDKVEVLVEEIRSSIK